MRKFSGKEALQEGLEVLRMIREGFSWDLIALNLRHPHEAIKEEDLMRRLHSHSKFAFAHVQKHGRSRRTRRAHRSNDAIWLIYAMLIITLLLMALSS